LPRLGRHGNPALLKLTTMPAENSQVLIVTGSSRGIGAVTAHLAAARGFRVCVNYCRQQPPAEAVVTAIQQKGGTAVAIQADVSSESDVVSSIPPSASWDR